MPIAPLIPYIGLALTGISTIAALGRDSNPAAAPAPAAAAPTVMPIPDDAAVQKAKKGALAGLQARRGRDSTILSDNTQNDLLGA